MKRRRQTPQSESGTDTSSGIAFSANESAIALDELLEYIGCQVDPELRVLAMRVEETMKSRFKCGHVRDLHNIYPRCRICQMDTSRKVKLPGTDRADAYDSGSDRASNR